MATNYNTTDILGDFESAFGDRTAYGSQTDKDIERYKAGLQQGLSAKEENIKALGDEESALKQDINKGYRDAISDSSNKNKEILTQAQDTASQRREQAQELVENQKKAAELEANIAAAKATGGAKLSVSQLTALNNDITNQFTQSLNNALSDNLNFNVALDDKMTNLGFSVNDKNRILAEMSKKLNEEEAAPLLDAISEKYKTRDTFMSALSDTINAINKGQIDESVSAMQRSERLERDEAAFNSMTDEQKARDIRDRFGPTWNVLTPQQKQKIINDTVSGKQTFRETLDLIQNLNSKSETNIQERLQTIASGTDDDFNKDILSASSVSLYDRASTTPTGTDYTGPDTLNTRTEDSNILIPGVNSPNQNTNDSNTNSDSTSNNTNTNTGYKVGRTTYVSEDAYNRLERAKPQLLELRKTNPTRYQEVAKALRDKYTIQTN